MKTLYTCGDYSVRDERVGPDGSVIGAYGGYTVWGPDINGRICRCGSYGLDLRGAIFSMKVQGGQIKGLDVLRAEAEDAVSFRRHVLSWDAPYHGEVCSMQIGRCRKCGKEVQIITNPLPNQIHIGGEAVALDCFPAITTGECPNCGADIPENEMDKPCDECGAKPPVA